MSEDSIKRLQRANPVTEPLPIPPFATSVKQDDDERPVVLVRHGRSHTRRNGALALAGVAGAAAVSVLLASGSSNSPVDVLAAVYAATAPRAGIVESVTVVRDNLGPGQRRTERLRGMAAGAGLARAGFYYRVRFAGERQRRHRLLGPHLGSVDRWYPQRCAAPRERRA